jgi:hypothetical protein
MSNKPRSRKRAPISSSNSVESSSPQTETPFSPGYTPPPPPASPPSCPEIEIPTPPPFVMEESPSFGKLKPTSITLVKATEKPPEWISQRPDPVPVLGNKGAECFAWSAAHDDDAEFLRRYGDPQRAIFMLSFHAGDPATRDARKRLKTLTEG